MEDCGNIISSIFIEGILTRKERLKMITEEERQAYLFIIEQLRLAIRDLKEDNERSEEKC